MFATRTSPEDRSMATATYTTTRDVTSVPHAYAEKGRYKIAVKVIDIFGNDTTKVVEVVL